MLQTIGTVVALGPGIYNIEDRGDQICANGDPGHALHLWSRTHNPGHSLSDVVIDLRLLRFCSLRFGVREGGLMGGTVIIEQHFADIGGYWLQTDGFLDGTARIAASRPCTACGATDCPTSSFRTRWRNQHSCPRPPSTRLRICTRNGWWISVGAV